MRALQVSLRPETRSTALRTLASLFLDKHPRLERSVVARWVLDDTTREDHPVARIAELQRLGVEGVAEVMLR